jgi:ABC-2 type transport system ATP-binding protein
MTAEGLFTEGLVRRYDDVLALDNFELTVDRGEVVGLVGANGAGKTTFAEVVAGLVRPQAGVVRVAGVDMLRHPRAARRHLGYAPQEVSLYFSATVRDNLRLFGGLAGLHHASLRTGIAEVVAAMQLDSVLDRPVAVLSGGQRRRTQIATSLLGHPDLLLLDEPTAGADPSTRDALLDVVRQRAAGGAAIVYTTHYLPELADLEASLAVAKNGRVIARGEQDVLLKGLLGELRIEIDGVVPDRLCEWFVADDNELRIPTSEPARTLAEVLATGLVPRSIDVRKPSLDDLYHSLDSVVSHAI